MKCRSLEALIRRRLQVHAAGMGPFTIAVWLLLVALAAPSRADGSHFAAKPRKQPHFSEAVCREALQRKVRLAGRRFIRRLNTAIEWPLLEPTAGPRSRSDTRLLSAKLFLPAVDRLRITGCTMRMEIISSLLGSVQWPVVGEAEFITGNLRILAKISWPGPHVENVTLSSRTVTSHDEDDGGPATVTLEEVVTPLLMARIPEVLPSFFLAVFESRLSGVVNAAHVKTVTPAPASPSVAPPP